VSLECSFLERDRRKAAPGQTSSRRRNWTQGHNRRWRTFLQVPLDRGGVIETNAAHQTLYSCRWG
jgi:hypothetical protein